MPLRYRSQLERPLDTVRRLSRQMDTVPRAAPNNGIRLDDLFTTPDK